MLHYPQFPAGTKIKDRPEPTPEEQAERIGVFQAIVDSSTRKTVKWRGREGKPRSLMVDIMSAGAVVAVWKAVDERQKALLARMEPDEMIATAWKLAK